MQNNQNNKKAKPKSQKNLGRKPKVKPEPNPLRRLAKLLLNLFRPKKGKRGRKTQGKYYCRTKAPETNNGSVRTFTKLSPDIVTSSRWVGSSSDEKVVLTTLLALKDKDGYVWPSVPGIAKLAEVSIVSHAELHREA